MTEKDPEPETLEVDFFSQTDEELRDALAHSPEQEAFVEPTEQDTFFSNDGADASQMDPSEQSQSPLTSPMSVSASKPELPKTVVSIPV